MQIGPLSMLLNKYALNKKRNYFLVKSDDKITYNNETASRIELPKLKKAANQLVANKYLKKANQKAAETPCQGELVTLLGQEETDISCKSLIYMLYQRG